MSIKLLGANPQLSSGNGSSTANNNNNANAAGNATPSAAKVFNVNAIAEKFINYVYQEDKEGEFARATVRQECESFKDNVVFANNHFASESAGLKHTIFHAKKSFFNHKYQTQEVLRSQHLYKLMHELKYTPDKNLQSYPDVLESGYREVLKVDDKDFEIRNALVKWYQHRLDMITFVRRELHKQYFELFACDIDGYSEQSSGIEAQLKQAEEARIEVEEVMRSLQAEQFFKSSRHYEKQHLPELSVVCDGTTNDVIERIYTKRLKNFPYITIEHIKRYFNDFSNQHHCMRKIKKIRIINDFIMYKVQFLHTQKQAKSASLSKIASNYEADELLRELNKAYAVRRSYLLANDKLTIERNVAEFAKQIDIKEDPNIDYGCLLLFAIDKKFDTMIAEQSDGFLIFHPYDLKPPFMSMKKEKSLTKLSTELSKTIEKERSLRDNVKIRSSKSWIDNVQILQSQEIDQREQDAVYGLYEDTLINGWLRFLLCTDENLISQKITKEISVFKDRFLSLNNKKQFEEIFYQFYARYLKLLFIKSRKSLIKILSYMNYFRCTQKNLNIAHIEQLNSHMNLSAQPNPENHGSAQDQAAPTGGQAAATTGFNHKSTLFQQSEQMISKSGQNDKFFLTNPALASFGNLTQFKANSAVGTASKADYIKLGGKTATISEEVQGESQEPTILYEEEVISIEGDIVTIRDHNSLKIIYDASMHDFHVILKKVAEVCSFYFHFRIKHDMSQKDKDKGLFKDNFDREALIDTLLNLEAQFYFKKVRVVESLKTILANTYYPNLRSQLIKLIATIIARRPRLNLFENKIFECYHYEIQNLHTLNEILKEVLADIEKEEQNLDRVKAKIAMTTNTSDDGHDKLADFYSALKSPRGHTRKFNYFMSGIAKLVVNIESNREQFAQLIPSASSEPGLMMSEILKCENAYLKDLLETTKKIVHDADGLTVCQDFVDFRFIEKDETLDSLENFDVIANRIQSHVDEKMTKTEREKMDFNAYSMLEFIKVRRKLNNFLFGLASLLDIYRIQVTRVGEEFREKFEAAIDISSIPSAGELESGRRNYLKLLLDVGGVKIAKEISAVDNWVGFITQTKGLVQLTQYLEALILSSQLTQNYIILNNIYSQAVLNDMPKEFFKKIKHAAPDHFKNIFDKKKFVATDSITFVRNQELNKNNKTKENEEATGKNFLMQIFCKRLKREVQFEAMKIQTLLQRIQIEKFSKKLPFEEPIFKFTPISPIKEQVNTANLVPFSMASNMVSQPHIEEELDSKGEVFFDTLGCAVKIFNMPSVEQINFMSHDDFEQVMQRYGMADLPDETDEEDEGDEDKVYEKAHHAGGKEWFRAQESKLEKGESLLTPNRNIQMNKGSTTLKGFRKREFLVHGQLLYLRKTQLFVLWKILGNMVNILSLSAFECSLEANPMDMLYFSHGQLGFEKCRIDTQNASTQEEQMTSQANLVMRQMSTAKSLKDLATTNKKAIPVFKRNELRMRRDIEVLQTQMSQLEQNLQKIRANPRIADSNEAIMSYLEKVQNRHFLTIILLLIKQLNASRAKNDIEFMLRLRSILLDLNFQQISHLAKYDDGRILVGNQVKFPDKSANFTMSPDLKTFESSSPFMNMIRLTFWDLRPKVEEKLHSTIAILNPTRYFFKQFLRFSSVLDKGLIGMAQSRVTELSVTKSSMDFLQNNFLRTNFVFEGEDPFKYERMLTKIINLQVRQYVLRETYLTRKLNILPFEMLPDQINDPLDEISKLIKEKLKHKMPQSTQLSSSFVNPTNKSGTMENSVVAINTKNNNKQSNQATAAGGVLSGLTSNTSTPEEPIMLELAINAFQVQQLMYDEAKEFYREENSIMSCWIQESRDRQNTKKAILSAHADSPHLISATALTKAFSNGSLCVLDTLSIISSFASKMFFDSAEVRTLNKKEALVIAKDDLLKHLHGINLDLIDLVDAKYAKNLSEVEKKCEILEHDVLFQKKWNKLLLKKIAFLEDNMNNIVESQVASRSNDLIQQIQQLERKAAYAEDQRQVDKVKMHADITNKFAGELKEKELANQALLSRYYDYRQGQQLEVLNMIEGIKDHNFKKLKDTIAKALESHGGLNQAIHIVEGAWNEVNQSISQKNKQLQLQQLQQNQQQLQSSAHQQMMTNQSIAAQGNPSGTSGQLGGSNVGRLTRTQHSEDIEDNNDGSHDGDENNFGVGNGGGLSNSNQLPMNLGHSQMGQNGINIGIERDSILISNQSQAQQMLQLLGQRQNLDVYENIEMQNKAVVKLLESFRLIRAFQNMKLACTVEKYERKIQSIYENNSSNEQLYRDKKEMEAQTESMKDLVISLKKTMAIMEYQNEILRRDVQRSRKERLKTMKINKAKDDEIRELKERIEMNLKEKTTVAYSNSGLNSNSMIRRGSHSQNSIQKRIRNSLQVNIGGGSNQQGQGDASIPINTETSLQNQQMQQQQQMQQWPNQLQQQQLSVSQEQSKNLFFASSNANMLEVSGSMKQTPRTTNNQFSIVSPAGSATTSTNVNTFKNNTQKRPGTAVITAATSQYGFSELDSGKREIGLLSSVSRQKDSLPDLRNLQSGGSQQQPMSPREGMQAQSALFKRTNAKGVVVPTLNLPVQTAGEGKTTSSFHGIQNTASANNKSSAKNKLTMTFKMPAKILTDRKS